MAHPVGQARMARHKYRTNVWQAGEPKKSSTYIDNGATQKVCSQKISMHDVYLDQTGSSLVSKLYVNYDWKRNCEDTDRPRYRCRCVLRTDFLI